jgi:hypothetical protein
VTLLLHACVTVTLDKRLHCCVRGVVDRRAVLGRSPNVGGQKTDVEGCGGGRIPAEGTKDQEACYLGTGRTKGLRAFGSSNGSLRPRGRRLRLIITVVR